MSNLIASFEICELFASCMSTGLDFSSLEVREEEDIDVLCDSDTTITLPTIEEVRGEKAAFERLLTIQQRLENGTVYIDELSQVKIDTMNTYVDKHTQFTALMGRLEFWTTKYNSLSVEEKKEKAQSFYRWKKELWNKANPVREAKNSSYNEYKAADELIKKYRAKWYQLMEEGKALAEEFGLWNDFFSLRDLEFNKYWCESDSDELDSLDILYRKDYSSDLAFSHIIEMNEYGKDVRIDWTFQDERMTARKEAEELSEQDWDSLLASSPL